MWFLVVAAGAAVLGYFIFYGERKTEKAQPLQARARRDEATRDVYRSAERDEEHRSS
jgi:hypothetical protein